MIIDKIYIGSFGGLRHFTLELGDGMNIIEGPNEAGKTTIASFCCYILYGFDKNEKNLRLNLDDSSANGYLEIRTENNRYRIERESTPAGRDRLSVVDLSDNTLCMKNSVPGEVLLGVPAELFYHTAYISQAQGAAIHGDSIYEALQNLLSSGNEAINIQKALKKLQEARISLLHKNEKGGRIAELKKERELLSARLYRATESNKKIILNESSLSDARKKLDENKKKRDELDIRIKYLDAGAIVRNYNHLHALQEEEKRLLSEYQTILEQNTYNGFIPDAAYTLNIKDLERDIIYLRDELKTIENERIKHTASEPKKTECEEMISRIEDMGGKYEILKRVEHNSHTYKFRKTTGILSFVLFLVLTAAAIFFIFINENIVFISSMGASAILLLAGAIILLNLSAVPRNSTNDILDHLEIENIHKLTKCLDDSLSDEIRLQIYSERLNEINKKSEAVLKKSNERQSELFNQLRRWGRKNTADAITDAETFFNNSQKKLREIENCRNSILHLTEQLKGYDEEKNREIYLQLSEDYHELNADEIKDKENISGLRTNYDFFCKQNASLVERCHLLENQITELRAVTEKPAALSDLIYAIDEELSFCVKRHNAYVLAYEQLTGAAEGLRSNITPNLSYESGKLLNTVTGGRYSEIGIGTDMSMVYTVRDLNGDADTRSIDYMSSGTRDLAYISLRLALMNYIHPISVPPVIFDESFARLDDDRLVMTMNLIAKYVQQGYQVLFLTSQKRDAVIMKNIAIFKHIILQ